MSSAIAEVYDRLQEKDFQVKLAHVKQYYKDDSSAMGEIGKAIEQVKLAEADGKFGGRQLSDADVLSLAVDLVETDRTEKLAGAFQQLGHDVVGVLIEKGVTRDEFDKLSEEEKVVVAQEIGKQLREARS